jgi:YbbR domain-containing protein
LSPKVVLSISCIVVAVCLYFMVNVKVNFTLEEATKAQKGSIGIALLFL